MPEAPWDTSPATQNQLDYAEGLIKRLAAADLAKLDTTVMSSVITNLNSARRTAGVPFEPMEGMDSARRQA